MTNQEKDQLTAEVGKEVPEQLEYDQSISLGSALDWCLRKMGAKT